MTPTREAIVLPSLLLTVALAAGVRPGTPFVVEPPSLFALVLAVLLGGALVQSGALDPLRVMNSSRSALANGNGMVLLGALFLASAQVFSLLTPESGLPRILLSVYFLVLMFHTMAAAPDRVHVLRSLSVTLGVAFVLKFVILDALADPASGRLGRALQMLLDGVTLGALTQDLQHPAAGYLAFLTVGMFLVSVWMLPRARRTRPSQRFPAGHGDATRERLPSAAPAPVRSRTAERRESPDGSKTTP